MTVRELKALLDLIPSDLMGEVVTLEVGNWAADAASLRVGHSHLASGEAGPLVVLSSTEAVAGSTAALIAHVPLARR